MRGLNRQVIITDDATSIVIPSEQRERGISHETMSEGLCPRNQFLKGTC